LALAVAFLASGCLSGGGPSDSANGGPGSDAPVPPASDSDALTEKDQVNRALLTVYYFAHAGDLKPDQAQLLPPELRPTRDDLLAAAKVIAADSSEAGSSRRRRAIVKLAVAGRETHDYKVELGILGAPQETIDHALRAQSDADRDELESELWNELAAASSYPIAWCPVTWPRVKVVPTWPTRTMQATVTVDVRRTVSELTSALDPQSWSRCDSTFFDKSYVALESGYEVPVDSKYDPTPDADKPSSGQAWDRMFFEEFRFGSGILNISWFKNLLVVQTEVTQDEFRVDYDLYRAVRSKYSSDERDGGLDKDQGFLRVRGIDDDWSRYEAVKTLRFFGRGQSIDDQLNAWSYILLQFSPAAVIELVCCPSRASRSAVPQSLPGTPRPSAHSAQQTGLRSQVVLP
jgi:hypothetical protein